MLSSANARQQQLLERAIATAGFFPLEEATALYNLACRALKEGLLPMAEIGAYRGRSSLFLAAALASSPPGAPGAVLFSIDHHHGSEEMQAGWADHDASLVDPLSGRLDSLAAWRSTVSQAEAEDLVIGVIGDSPTIARSWGTLLGLVLLDGGHGREIAWADYLGWSAHLLVGGYLVLHDVFPNPEDGGRPPYECYADALGSKRFAEDEEAGCASLRVLVKLAS